jgi:hypothetical protein
VSLSKMSLDCIIIGELDLGRVCHCLGEPALACCAQLMRPLESKCLWSLAQALHDIFHTCQEAMPVIHGTPCAWQRHCRSA